MKGLGITVSFFFLMILLSFCEVYLFLRQILCGFEALCYVLIWNWRFWHSILICLLFLPVIKQNYEVQEVFDM